MRNINSGASSTTNCIYEDDKIIETNEFSKIIYQMNKGRLIKYTTYSLEDKETGKYKENQTVFYEYKNNMKIVSKVIDSYGTIVKSDDGGSHMFYDQEGASFPKKPVRAIYNKDSRGNWTSRTIYFEDGTVRKDSRTILYR
ncbi:hypothetical protein DC3_31270 [Deinococcus cellulosilyticus NBRC 106333 = KACC 11606]|uniref:Uncharacterized protein n=1 Tax=Deinococcus cellulosilyticus (strain DSM 18568 / NBRC 106333 / KACC 11606 / 5516J-15) TaxID=1223518 RepID=A0A511N3T2_DEIC1|nr:hypothetical protein DC3_31270 [Deinococcus cellulosilyticus NBRC 106333 = KACC 11606]